MFFSYTCSFFLIIQGYIEALGKFEGDDFETLFILVDTTAALLKVLIAQGLAVEFDLSQKAFVFEDTADPTSIILDYRGNIVVFKVSARLFFFAFISLIILFCQNILSIPT